MCSLHREGECVRVFLVLPSANRITRKHRRELGDKMLSTRFPWRSPGVPELTTGANSAYQSFAHSFVKKKWN